MHQTRAQTSRHMPIPRKGTQYVAKSLSHSKSSITALIAIKEILKLAHTAKEAREMMKAKKLKINGRVIRDLREPICLFAFFEADKKYKLILLPTGRYSLEETKDHERIAKVIGKKMLTGKVIQLNLHEGTNVLSKNDVKVGDSVLLDAHNKVVKVISLDKGSKAFVRAGKNQGEHGTITHVEGRQVTIKFEGNKSSTLAADKVVAL